MAHASNILSPSLSSSKPAAKSYFFVTAKPKFTLRGPVPKVDAQAQRRFVQKGRRHAYPETIFQPSRRNKQGQCKSPGTTSTRANPAVYDSSDAHESIISTPQAHASSPDLHIILSHTECNPTTAVLCSMLPMSVPSLVADSVIEMSSDILSLMQYYSTVYHPAIWYAEVRSTSNQALKRCEEGETVVRDAIQDRTYIYALLAAAASRLENVDYHKNSHVDKLMSHALFGVRNLLEKKPESEIRSDNTLLRILIFLASAEGYALRFDAASFHIRAASKIINQRGGLSTVEDPKLRDMIVKVLVSVHSATFEICPIYVGPDFGFVRGQCVPEAVEYLTDLMIATSIPEQLELVLESCGIKDPKFAELVHEVAACEKVLNESSNRSTRLSEDLSRWLFR